jgi:hypothetical protein
MADEAAPSCPRCGKPTPDGARFCPSCGAELVAEENGGTREVPLPEPETGPVPVSFEVARPRLFGVPPPLGIFALAVAALAFAVVAFVSGSWPVGLVALAVSLVLLAFFLQLARKPSAGAFATASTAFVDSLGARAGFFRTSVGALSQARREVLHLKQRLLQLSGEREAELRALGEAALRKDNAEMRRLRGRIGELDAEVAQLEQTIAETVKQARTTVGEERLAIQPTQRVTLDDDEAADSG